MDNPQFQILSPRREFGPAPTELMPTAIYRVVGNFGGIIQNTQRKPFTMIDNESYAPITTSYFASPIQSGQFFTQPLVQSTNDFGG